MYCPKCKKYDKTNFNPIENIKAFMKFIKSEKYKLGLKKNKIMIENRRKKRIGDTNFIKIPEDSVGEITDLDEE
jgi:hypothetical protein